MTAISSTSHPFPMPQLAANSNREKENPFELFMKVINREPEPSKKIEIASLQPDVSYRLRLYYKIINETMINNPSQALELKKVVTAAEPKFDSNMIDNGYGIGYG